MIWRSLSKGDLQILDRLLRSRKLDPAEARRDIGAGPTDIERCVNRLIKRGCRIEHRGDGAYELIESGLGVWADYLESQLTGEPKRKVEVYRRTTSTQDLAKKRAGKPLIVIADEQTAGRGRLGRSWIAPPGTAVLMSMTFPLDRQQDRSADRLVLVAAVAAATSIERLTGHKLVHIKWPNDLIIDRKKIGGILIETDASRRHAIVGIGINVSLTREHLTDMPDDLRDHVTSFALHGWRTDRLLVAATIINEIDRLAHSPHVPLIVDEWRCRSVLSDDVLNFRTNGQTLRGTAVDLDPDQGLIVRLTTGEMVRLHAATTTIESR